MGKLSVGDLFCKKRDVQHAGMVVYIVTRIENDGYIGYRSVPELTHVLHNTTTSSHIGGMSTDDDVILVPLERLCAKRQLLDDVIKHLVQNP